LLELAACGRYLSAERSLAEHQQSQSHRFDLQFLLVLMRAAASGFA
jgi:hypothetical protein